MVVVVVVGLVVVVAVVVVVDGGRWVVDGVDDGGSGQSLKHSAVKIILMNYYKYIQCCT